MVSSVQSRLISTVHTSGLGKLLALPMWVLSSLLVPLVTLAPRRLSEEICSSKLWYAFVSDIQKVFFLCMSNYFRVCLVVVIVVVPLQCNDKCKMF